MSICRLIAKKRVESVGKEECQSMYILLLTDEFSVHIFDNSGPAPI